MIDEEGKSIKINKKGERQKESEKLAIREPIMIRHPFDTMRKLDEEFDDFRRDMERTFFGPTFMTTPSFFGRPDITFPRIRFPEIRFPEEKQPLLDLKDTGKELILEAEMPGISKENIDIELTENSVKVIGETDTNKVDEKEGYYRQERSCLRFHREIPLPEEIIPNIADAKLENGILKITLPKKTPTPESKIHRLKVK